MLLFLRNIRERGKSDIWIYKACSFTWIFFDAILKGLSTKLGKSAFNFAFTS
jgi:hypothetical protein